MQLVNGLIDLKKGVVVAVAALTVLAVACSDSPPAPVPPTPAPEPIIYNMGIFQEPSTQNPTYLRDTSAEVGIL